MSESIREIYERLIPEEIAKPGRHYEVLAAFVWNWVSAPVPLAEPPEVWLARLAWTGLSGWCRGTWPLLKSHTDLKSSHVGLPGH